jgi:hypothetical protein
MPVLDLHPILVLALETVVVAFCIAAGVRAARSASPKSTAGTPSRTVRPANHR